jgi:hypothetical protein
MNRSLVHLEDLSILRIASYLTDENDLLNFTKINSRCFNLLSNNSRLWINLIRCRKISLSVAIDRAALQLSFSGCHQKKVYLIGRKVQNNFRRGRCNPIGPPQNSAVVTPIVIGHLVFWLDWPNRFKDVFGDPRQRSNILIYEYNGMSRKQRIITVECPDYVAMFSRLSLKISVRDSVAILVFELPEMYGQMPSILEEVPGTSSSKQVIAVDINSHSKYAPVLWTRSFGISKNIVLLSASKFMVVSEKEIQFFNVQSGFQTSLDITKFLIVMDARLRFYDSRMFNDKFAAFWGDNGVLVVDTVNETIREIREMNADYRGYGAMFLHRDRLVKFIDWNRLTVWNVQTGDYISNVNLSDLIQVSGRATFGRVVSPANVTDLAAVVSAGIFRDALIASFSEVSDSEVEVKSYQTIKDFTLSRRWELYIEEPTIVHGQAIFAYVPTLQASKIPTDKVFQTLRYFKYFISIFI